MRQVDAASVQYRKSLLGKTEVIYDCPRCKESLRSPLSDSGNQDHCPHCDCEFIVPGEEELLRIEKAKEEKRLKAIEKAKEEERLRAEKAHKARLEAEKAKEEERLRAEKAHNQSQNQPQTNSQTPKTTINKSRNSNHYISLGLMYILSVITKSFWIGILIFVGSIALSIDIFAKSGIGLLVFLGCFVGVIMLAVEQWSDIFSARKAFKDGSDPDKTTD